MAQTDQRVRRRVTFSGQVQGVGFRYAACQVAADHPVTGYVRNLPGGKVEVVLEGPVSACDEFLRKLSQRMDGYIGGSQVEEQPARGEFEQFEVRF